LASQAYSGKNIEYLAIDFCFFLEDSLFNCALFHARFGRKHIYIMANPWGQFSNQ